MKKSPLQPKWRNTGLNAFRFAQIKSHFTGKKVLDVGSAVGYKKKNWMHAQIKEVAASVRGIDIDSTAVKEIQQKGYNVEVGDAQNFNLSETFDVIHAGELIEHLDNFHGFLQSCRNHLTPGGVLIITTPNGMRISNFVYSAFGGLLVNEEHTCWFCEDSISSLLQRNGFEVEKVAYIKHQSKGLVRKVTSKIVRSILPERVVWNTLLVIAKPNGAV